MKHAILHTRNRSVNNLYYFGAQLFNVDSSLFLLQLLDFEARSAEQVPLLLKMKRSQLALSKAVESGDTDLGERSDAAPSKLKLLPY